MQTAEQDSSPRHPNYFRRTIGMAICLCPIILTIASLVFAIGQQREKVWGLIPAILGLLVGMLNVYLSFIRPWLYRRRRSSQEESRHVSDIPLLGTFLVMLAGIIGFGEMRTSVISLLTLALDTGGLPWFLVFTWQDTSLWDA